MKELIVSNSFYDFLIKNQDENRIAKFLRNALRYQSWGYPIYRLMVTTDKINYLTLREDGTISFLPEGKEHLVTENGTWSRSSRQNGSAGKVIKKILTPKAQKLFTHVEYESFVNRYKSACDAEHKRFEIWDNERIPEAYDMKRESGGGTLNDSCMNGDGGYLDIYRCCPHLKILVLLNSEDRLAGRALLWRVDDGKTLMDRVYTAHDHYYDMFLEYAESNGFIRKVEYKSYRDKHKFWLNGEVFERKYTIKTQTQFSQYPYIDTFTYGGDGFLTNYDGHEYEYCNTDGSRNGDDDEGEYYCEHSGNYYDEEDVRYIRRGRYADSYIHERYAVYCESDGHYYYENDDDIVYLDGYGTLRTDDDNVAEVNGDYVHRDDVEWSEYHEEYIMNDDAIWSDHHSTFIKKDEAVTTPDGSVWHKDDITEC